MVGTRRHRLKSTQNNGHAINELSTDEFEREEWRGIEPLAM